jgi:hypothetical protein
MQDLYFKNHEAKIIFGLVVLGGKPQMDLLGINMVHYSEKTVAKKWYEENKNILKASTHEKATEAMEVLEKIYKGMK